MKLSTALKWDRLLLIIVSIILLISVYNNYTHLKETETIAVKPDTLHSNIHYLDDPEFSNSLIIVHHYKIDGIDCISTISQIGSVSTSCHFQ